MTASNTTTTVLTRADILALGHRAYAHRDDLRWRSDNLRAALEAARALLGELEGPEPPAYATTRAIDGILAAVEGALTDLGVTLRCVVQDDDESLVCKAREAA